MFPLSLKPLHIVARALGLILGIDIHECAHAWAANELGDPTARYRGRLSLNPLVHLDPMGTLMMLFSLFYGFGIGWGKPVPVNPWNLRRGQVGQGLVALAGPVSNLVLAAVLVLPMRAGLLRGGAIGEMWITLISVNVSLALFNLLPIPPLDGASVLIGVLSAIRQPWAYEWAQALEQFKAQAPMAFMLLIVADQMLGGRILGLVLGGPYRFLMRSMLGM
ncbi:MAG: site-2 protease family protein [Chloroflexota bacterium]|nr:site-2 protease family protein [Chloroflexota bacterium]